MKKKDVETEIMKVPVQLEGFSFRKTTQDWGITFSLQPENLPYGQPLQGHMNQHFIIALIKISDKDKVKDIMELEDIPFKD